MDHAYWLSSSNSVIGTEGQVIQNVSKSKDINVGTITQPTMASFANIFAGASAAIASSSNLVDVNTDMLQNGKNFMVGPSVPPLTQIEIQSSNQLSKRSGVFPIPCTLPGMATISNIGLANANMIISGTPAQISGDLQQITSGQITFASAPQMTVAISKDFIQQAAAESGVAIGINNNNSVQAQIYTEQQLIPTSVSVSLSSDLAPVAYNQDTSIELEKPLKCPECSLTFKQAGQLTYHTFVAHGQLQERPHKCIVCPESFLETHHLQDHVKAVHPSLNPGHNAQNPVDFTCSECHATFSSGGGLNYHLYMAHTLQRQRTVQPANVQQQIVTKIVTEDSFAPNRCNQCGKHFMKSSLLSSHLKNVHGVNDNCPLLAVGRGGAVVEVKHIPKQHYPCGSCDKVFKLPQHLKQHLLSIHEKPHKCDICGKGFGRKSDLNRHTRGVHMRERPHSCNKCGWTFAEAGNLKHHVLAVHSKEKNFRCSVCSRSFSIQSYLKTHLQRVHGIVETTKINGSATAPVSTSVTNTQQTYLVTTGVNQGNNIATIHTSSIPQTQVSRCFECGQVFSNTSLLQNHVMSTHPQPFWCTVCGEGFSQAYQLQNHLQIRHSDSNTNFHPLNVTQINAAQAVVSNPAAVNASGQTSVINAQITNPSQDQCTECGMFIDKGCKNHICPGVRKFHKATLNAASSMAFAGERPHLCSKCGKGFKTATHLRQHVRCVHSKDRPHKCQRCSKSFSRTSDLNRHVKGVHDKLKPRARALRLANSKCTECGASFSELSQLKRHFLTVHLNQRPSFKCADCQEGFPDEQRFKSHICHEQERPHTCTVCSKRFTEMTQVRRHLRSAHGQHSTQHQHRCDQCRRSFTRPVDLERHVHAVHLKEKPHKCSYCNKYFGLHGNLNKHIRAVHMLEKPHQCVECGKCFAHIGVLKRHLRDIHFYDRRPSQTRKSKSVGEAQISTSVANQNVGAHVVQSMSPDGSRQPDDVSHLVVLQALESIQQEQLIQQHTQVVHSQQNLTHQQPQVVQQSPQILPDPVPPTPSTPI